MGKYETKHAIGDLVYLANSGEVDRDVIKAIKITGVKESVQYGIKSKRSSLSVWSMFYDLGDGYNWYRPSEIFTDKESANALHENLKTKYEAEQAVEKAKQKAERRKELEEQLHELDQS